MADEEMNTTQTTAPVNTEVASLQAELDTLRNHNRELLSDLGQKKVSLSQYAELGGVDDVRTKLSELNKKADGKNDVDTIKSEYQRQLEEKDTALNTLRSGMLNDKVESLLDEAIREQKGFADLLKPVLKDRVRADLDAAGQLKVTILDKNGNPKLIDNGKDATIADLVAEYKTNEIYSRAFDGTGITGTGTRNSSGSTGGSGNPYDKNGDSYNVSAGMQLFKENPAHAKQLMVEAGFPVPQGL
tara:strand:- start:40 stop:771 length:732 start_codon:yes stop_codon:yes gene_type:complete